MKSRIIIILLISSWVQYSFAQCFDADATIWENTWSSCQTSANPKSEYGNTHWLQFDLGLSRNLSKTWVWNSNEPGKLNQGFNAVKIDYSTDGTDWTYFGEMNFPQAQGEAVYGGFSGPDFSNIQARYVLLTVVSTHGHATCAGLAEMKFNLLPIESGELPDDGEVDCLTGIDFFVEEVTEIEALIVWEAGEDLEDALYMFQYRPVGSNSWLGVETEEPEVFLEDLMTNTTYEFRIGIECDEETIFSETDEFITGEGGEGCGEFAEVLIESVWETGAFLSWNFTGEAESFLVIYGSEDGEEQEIETQDFEIELEDLTTETEYYVEVVAVCGDLEIFSDTYEFFTSDEFLNYTSKPTLSVLKSQVFPNPTKGVFSLQIQNEGTSDALNFFLTDAAGKVVQRNLFSTEPGINTQQIDLSGVPDGIYFLQGVMIGSRARVSERIVKVR